MMMMIMMMMVSDRYVSGVHRLRVDQFEAISKSIHALYRLGSALLPDSVPKKDT